MGNLLTNGSQQPEILDDIHTAALSSLLYLAQDNTKTEPLHMAAREAIINASVQAMEKTTTHKYEKMPLTIGLKNIINNEHEDLETRLQAQRVHATISLWIIQNNRLSKEDHLFALQELGKFGRKDEHAQLRHIIESAEDPDILQAAQLAHAMITFQHSTDESARALALSVLEEMENASVLPQLHEAIRQMKPDSALYRPTIDTYNAINISIAKDNGFTKEERIQAINNLERYENNSTLEGLRDIIMIENSNSEIAKIASDMHIKSIFRIAKNTALDMEDRLSALKHSKDFVRPDALPHLRHMIDAQETPPELREAAIDTLRYLAINIAPGNEFAREIRIKTLQDLGTFGTASEIKNLRTIMNENAFDAAIHQETKRSYNMTILRVSRDTRADNEERQLALQEIERFGDISMRQHLIDIVQNDTDTDILEEAKRAYNGIHLRIACNATLDDQTRIAALHNLGRFGQLHILPDLDTIITTTETGSDIQKAAENTYNNINLHVAQNAAFNSDDRLFALQELGRFGNNSLSPVIAQITDDPDLYYTMQNTLALISIRHKIGNQNSNDILGDLKKLEQLGKPFVQPELRRLIEQQQNPAIRQVMQDTYININLDIAQNMMLHDRERLSALQELGKFGKHSFLPVIENMMYDPENTHIEQAIHATTTAIWLRTAQDTTFDNKLRITALQKLSLTRDVSLLNTIKDISGDRDIEEAKYYASLTICLNIAENPGNKTNETIEALRKLGESDDSHSLLPLLSRFINNMPTLRTYLAGVDVYHTINRRIQNPSVDTSNPDFLQEGSKKFGDISKYPHLMQIMEGKNDLVFDQNVENELIQANLAIAKKGRFTLEERISALQDLREAGDISLLPHLQTLANDTTKFAIRRTALETIPYISIKIARDRTRNKDERLLALNYLKESRIPVKPSDLHEIITEDDPILRHAAIETYVSINWIIANNPNTAKSERLSAFQELGKFGNSSIIRTIYPGSAEESDPELQQSANAAFLTMRVRENTSNTDRLAYLEGLEMIGNESALPHLHELLHTTGIDSDIHYQAERAYNAIIIRTAQKTQRTIASVKQDKANR